MVSKPLIAVTMGDPAGIGPEIVAKAVAGGELFDVCTPVVIGDAAVMKKAITGAGLAVNMRSIGSPAEAKAVRGVLDILDLNLVDPSRHAWGKPDAAAGNAVYAYIKTAVEAALKGEVDAITTAPISKAILNAAGHHYAGHTELLAALTGSKEYGMLFVGGGLRVMLATIHVALKDVPGLITAGSLLKSIRLAHRAMRYFGMEKPRIGVAALNPHAGEGGLFGNEEWDRMLPALVKARQEGIDASDPLPADTLFYKARNNYFDVVVAMYHDQGLAPLKMVAFGNSVNVTVGLPVIRTSVDHGTAYDIAGKWCADPASLLAAVKLAANMAVIRRSRQRSPS